MRRRWWHLLGSLLAGSSGLCPSTEAKVPGWWTSPSCSPPRFRPPSLTLTLLIPETAPSLLSFCSWLFHGTLLVTLFEDAICFQLRPRLVMGGTFSRILRDFLVPLMSMSSEARLSGSKSCLHPPQLRLRANCITSLSFTHLMPEMSTIKAGPW